VLDEQPVFARAALRFRIAALHVNEDPLALHALAVEHEFEVALLEAGQQRLVLLPGLGLRPDDEEVEDEADAGHLQQEDGEPAARAGRAGRAGAGPGSGTATSSPTSPRR